MKRKATPSEDRRPISNGVENHNGRAAAILPTKTFVISTVIARQKIVAAITVSFPKAADTEDHRKACIKDLCRTHAIVVIRDGITDHRMVANWTIEARGAEGMDFV